MSFPSTTSVYHTWYAIRDECLINKFKRYIEENERASLPVMTEMLRRGIEPPVKFIFLTGDAGTGKTWIQIHLINLKHVCFMCPTNISGQVMANTLSDQCFFGKTTFKVDKTIYKHFCETPDDTKGYDNILYNNNIVSQNARNGILNSLAELYREYGPSMHIVCQKRYLKLCQKNNYVTPREYTTAKRAALESGWMSQGGQFDNDNEAVVQYMLATGIAGASNIPNPLRYNKYVIDEAGRVTAMTGFLLVYYHYFVHALYDTDAKDIIPTLLLVGSGLQCHVINDTVYKINDYSLITMLGAPFFRNVSYMCKHQKFGRRCNRGKLAEMTSLTDILERLELGQPLTLEVKKRFLDCFAVTDPKEFIDPKTTDRVHIAKRHEVLSNIQKNVFKRHVQKDVVEYFMTSTNREDIPYCVYRAQEDLGACYRSVVYKEERWIKSEKREPMMFAAKKTGWKYRNSRSMLIDTLYKVTHFVSCTLIAIDGSLKDFVNDIEAFKDNICSSPDRIKSLIILMFQYLNIASEMIRHHSESLYDNVKNLSSIISSLEGGGLTSEEEKDSFAENQRQMARLQGIKLEIEALIDKYITMTSSENDPPTPIKISKEYKGYVLLQGNTVLLKEVTDKYLIVRLGKTLYFKVYRKILQLNRRSVFHFSTSPNRYIEARRKRNIDGLYVKNKKRQGGGDIDDLLFSDEEESLSETLRIKEVSINDVDNVIQEEDRVTFYFFPIKTFLVETIDSTQSASFDFKHIVLLTKSMSAEDFIVACTRARDTELLKVYCETGKGFWSIKPLRPDIEKTVRIINKEQQKTGWL